MIKLSVNVNKVALLRNAREGKGPNVVQAAQVCLDAGADGITVHPRPDGRHIRTADVMELDALTRARGVELNIEGYPSADFLELVQRVRPAQCTLVPDDPAQRTSDHGWDLGRSAALLRETIAGLAANGIRVSLFVEPDATTIAPARELGAECVELYTEYYASAFGTAASDEVLARYVAAAEAAHRVGLRVNAGHDLNQANLPLLCASLPALSEVSIGHALIADALFDGLAATVRAYRAALQ